MPWVTVPYLKGKIYVPEKIEGNTAKHSCPDCYACQRCSDDRCSACLSKEVVEENKAKIDSHGLK